MSEKLTEHKPIRFGETQYRQGLALAASQDLGFGEYIRQLLDADLEKHRSTLRVLAGIFGEPGQESKLNNVAQGAIDKEKRQTD